MPQPPEPPSSDPFVFHENQKISKNHLKNRKERGEINAIYILPEYQHRGIGKTLFQFGKSKLEECGLTPFIAWVLKDNHQAIKFYKSMGFEVISGEFEQPGIGPHYVMYVKIQ